MAQEKGRATTAKKAIAKRAVNYGGPTGKSGNASMDPRAKAGTSPASKGSKSIPKSAVPFLVPPALSGKKPAPKQPTGSATAAIVQAMAALPKPLVKAPVGKTAGAIAGKTVGMTAKKAVAPIKAPVVYGGSKAPAVGSPVSGGGATTSKTSTTTKTATSGTASASDTAKKMQAFIDQARASVSNEDLPALNELQRQVDSLNAQYGKQSGDVQQRGAAAQSDLAELFGRLGNFTSKMQTDTDAQFNDVRKQSGEAFANLQGSLGKTYGAAQDNTNAELSRLGLGEVAPAANAGAARDGQFLQGLAGINGQNLVGGMSMQQQGFDNLMAMQRGSAATEGASRMAGSRQDTERTLSELLFALNEGTADVNGQRGDIIATQGQRARELAMALEDKDYSRRTEAAQTQLANQIALERLGMDKQQFATQQAAASTPQPLSYLDELKQSDEALSIQNRLAEAEALKKQQADWNKMLAELAAKNSGKPGLFGGMLDAFKPR